MISTRRNTIPALGKADFNTTSNTLIYFPCAHSGRSRSVKTLYDVGETGIILNDNVDTFTDGTVKNSITSTWSAKTIDGTLPNLSTKSFLFWGHANLVASGAFCSFVMGGVITNRVGGIMSGSAWKVDDGTTTVSSVVFTAGVVGQDVFRALVVDRTLGKIHAWESINGATVSAMASTSLGSLGAVDLSSETVVSVGGAVAQNIYGSGLHILDSVDTTALTTTLEALRVASKTAGKVLPNGL